MIGIDSGAQNGRCRVFRFGALFAIGVLYFGCSRQPSTKTTPPTAPTTTMRVDLEAVRPQVEAFCGDCHPVPPAASFARADWSKEVQRGFELYWDTGRTDLAEPKMHEVVAYYEALAPEALIYDVPPPAERAFPARFRRQDLAVPAGRAHPAVSNLLWELPADGSPGKLMLTDMRLGDVAQVQLGSELSHRRMASLGHPGSIDPADLDNDRRTDYLVADLGTFLPEDHDRGRVVWLSLDENSGWKSHVILEKVGRVAHAVDGDFDGDGKSDVLVAEFGWQSTGSLHLLRGTGDEPGRPTFENEVLDRRHGCSFVLPTDWDADGDLDFVSLFTQEHETVDLFLNDGFGKFTIETIYAATDPAFGSSGIELTDLDKDGDLDVLYTNGDAMDSMLAKPYHAVRWLENEGSFPFREHELATMPGVYKAVSADFDNDGDMDVAAIALPGPHADVSAGALSGAGSKPRLDVLILLEQTEPGQFMRHRLDPPNEGLALVAGDFDGDGDVDLAAGSFSLAAKAWVSLWWNDGANQAPETAQ